MALSIAELRVIARDILEEFRRSTPEQVRGMVQMQDYHGFAKSRLPDELVRKHLEPFGLTPADVQIEVVHVSSNLSHEVHVHQRSTAFVYGLGSTEHFPEARGARYYFVDRWLEFRMHGANEHLPYGIPISAGVPHGFTVEHGGELYFLSVQAPPIVDEQGRDDYHRIST